MEVRFRLLPKVRTLACIRLSRIDARELFPAHIKEKLGSHEI